MLFAATNEIPEQAELAALKDRFPLKVESRSVQDEHFTELIDSGLQGEAYKGLNQKPWVEGHATLDDFLKANRYLTLPVRPAGRGGGRRRGERPAPVLPDEVFRRVPAAGQDAGARGQIFISDRKLVKLYKLFRVRAWLFSGGAVSGTTCGCWRTWARRTRRSSSCGRRCRPSWGTVNI